MLNNEHEVNLSLTKVFMILFFPKEKSGSFLSSVSKHLFSEGPGVWILPVSLWCVLQQDTFILA